MDKINVTLAQIPSQKDLRLIKNILKKKKDSNLVVFPESTISTQNLDFLKEIHPLVLSLNLDVVLGVLYHNKGKTYDYSFFVSKKIEKYQKVHVHWTEKHVAGSKFKIVKTKYGNVGFLMCYDAAYIESSRKLRKKGAEIIVVISSIPAHFKNEYFNLRLRAIAYYNQVYVIHCCTSGKKYSGHSSIVNPKGRIIKELGKYESISSKTINLNLIKEWRKTEKTPV